MTIGVDEARNLLRESFSAAWVAAGEDLARVAFQNVPANVEDLPYWVRFSVQYTPQENNELGGGDYLFVTRGGIILAEIRVRLGETDVDSDRLANIVLAWLEQYGVGYIRINLPGLNDIGPGEGWYQTNAEAVFQYDTSRELQ